MISSEIENISPDDGAFYRFGNFCLDSRRNLLTASGEPVALTYKAIQTLLVLIEKQGQIVTKDEILDRVWRDTFVEENSLTRNISVLRKAFGDSPNSKRFIETVPRRGYRFIHEVTKTYDWTGCKNESENQSVKVTSDEPATNQNKFSVSAENSEVQNLNHGALFDSPAKVISDSEMTFAGESLIKSDARKRIRLPILIIILILAGGLSLFSAFSFKNYFFGRKSAADVRVSATKFTNTGNAQDAAISGDGRYVVYTADEGERQSLWVRQTGNGGAPVQILSPGEVSFQGLAFAPDGNSVYYNVWDRKEEGDIFRIPVLGGVPVKIIHDCMPSINVSPVDGRIVFIRGDRKENKQELLITEADGSLEKLIAEFNDKQWISAAVWSPDGKNLAAVLGTSNPPERDYVQLEEISLEYAARKPLSKKKWLDINQISWLPNGRGIVVNGADETEKNQLWQVALPSGDVRQIISEPSGYNGISTPTADGSMLVSVQHSSIFNVWTAPADHPEAAVKITDGRNEGNGACWTRDGKIVFTSILNAIPNIWIMQADGSDKKQLTGGNYTGYSPVTSPADGWIYFVTNRSNRPQIWRIDESGQNLKQMTEDYAGSRYSVSPDGKWLIYVRDISGEPGALWKIPTGGEGQPQRLARMNSFAPSVSPDGKLVAYSFWDENHNELQWGREIASFEDGQRIRSLNFPTTVNIGSVAIQLGWLPDQSGISYIDFKNKASNVWIQPLDEKRSAYQLTDFKDGRVFQFNWSPDGKKILFVQGSQLSDVVLIKTS